MARCQQCGRVNRDGSIFCQDCGQRLPAAPPGTGPVQAIPAPAANQASAPTMFPDQAGVIPPAQRVRQPTPIAGVPIGATCPSCRTVNPPGMNFCKMCGTPMKTGGTPSAGVPAGNIPGIPQGSPGMPSGLPSAAASVGGRPPANLGAAPAPARPASNVAVAPMPAPPPSNALRPCPSCGLATPTGFAFCQHCGARQGAAPARPATGGQPDPSAATMAVPGPANAAPSGNSRSDAYMPTLAPSNAVLAASLGTLTPMPPMSVPAVAPTPTPMPMQGTPTPAAGVPMTPPAGLMPFGPPPAQPHFETLRSPSTPLPQSAVRAQPAWGRLVAVHRDGSDGQVFPLTSEHVAIGRTDGEITFADDRYLAPRHVQIERRGAHTVLRVFDDVNGAYLRLSEPHPLSDGDQFLFGKQVMRFEMVAPPERDAPPAMQHGVLVFGSPPRATWGRLRQLLTTGQTRDLIHLSRSDVTLGREEGELRFPDDEFMSRRHATLSQRDGRVHLADLGSSNGTYVRLRAERELRPGDLIRVGDQLLRYEPS